MAASELNRCATYGQKLFYVVNYLGNDMVLRDGLYGYFEEITKDMEQKQS